MGAGPFMGADSAFALTLPKTKAEETRRFTSITVAFSFAV